MDWITFYVIMIFVRFINEKRLCFVNPYFGVKTCVLEVIKCPVMDLTILKQLS